MTPRKLGNRGKDLEDAVQARCKSLEKDGVCVIRKAGRKAVPTGMETAAEAKARASVSGGSPRPQLRWTAQAADVDFTGTGPGGVSVRFDCKTVSGSSFSINDDHFGAGQKSELLSHASVGAVCFLLIHYNARTIKSRSFLPLTVAVPVHPGHLFWQGVAVGKTSSLNLETAFRIGVVIRWVIYGRERTYRPDVLTAVESIRQLPLPDYLPEGVFPKAPF